MITTLGNVLFSRKYCFGIFPHIIPFLVLHLGSDLKPYMRMFFAMLPALLLHIRPPAAILEDCTSCMPDVISMKWVPG